MPVLLRKLRAFEQDCERWDESHSPKILPEKKRAVDDVSAYAERPERDVMNILYGLPYDSIKMVSPKSLRLKVWLKAPLLIFTTLAAMVSSISELFMKVIGCILKDATSYYDYLWLLLFVPLIAYTGSRTLVYVNYGIKYYD